MRKQDKSLWRRFNGFIFKWKRRIRRYMAERDRLEMQGIYHDKVMAELRARGETLKMKPRG